MAHALQHGPRQFHAALLRNRGFPDDVYSGVSEIFAPSRSSVSPRVYASYSLEAATAIAKGDIEAVGNLIQAGTDPNAQSAYGTTVSNPGTHLTPATVV